MGREIACCSAATNALALFSSLGRDQADYANVLQWAGGKPVTIRTVDAGGDKPVPGFTVEETNPFLGLRGRAWP